MCVAPVSIALIPARANSKGLPGKNLKPVGGASLLARAIRAATDSGRCDRVIVTTDGEDIAFEAQRCGAEVVMRPAALSHDHARTFDAVEHALQTLAIDDGVCVLLQPTSPLRTAADVQAALDLWSRSTAGSVVAMTECEHHPYKTFIQTNAELSPVHAFADMESPRQVLPLALRVNGAIYIATIETLLRERKFLIEPVVPYMMPAERSLDIDNALDLHMANIIFSGI